MKKSISILVLLGILATGAFAQGLSLSAGGGLLQWDYGIPLSEGAEGYNRALSFYGFFDANYAEFSVAFGVGNNTEKTDVDFLNLQFSLLGKYPFELGSVTFFPLLGARFVLPVWQKDKNSGFNAVDLAYLGLQGGVGFDYFFGSRGSTWRRGDRSVSEADTESTAQKKSNFFLRNELLFDLDFKGFGNFYENADTIQSVGPTFKIGVGYKF